MSTTPASERRRPPWVPESTGELKPLGTLPNGNLLYSNYPGRIEPDAEIVITRTEQEWSWRRFGRVLVIHDIGNFGGPNNRDSMSMGPGDGPLDFEVRSPTGEVIQPRYMKLWMGGRHSR